MFVLSEVHNFCPGKPEPNKPNSCPFMSKLHTGEKNYPNGYIDAPVAMKTNRDVAAAQVVLQRDAAGQISVNFGRQVT